MVVATTNEAARGRGRQTPAPHGPMIAACFPSCLRNRTEPPHWNHPKTHQGQRCALTTRTILTYQIRNSGTESDTYAIRMRYVDVTLLAMSGPKCHNIRQQEVLENRPLAISVSDLLQAYEALPRKAGRSAFYRWMMENRTEFSEHVARRANWSADDGRMSGRPPNSECYQIN
jgi:hypothetical protein